MITALLQSPPKSDVPLYVVGVYLLLHKSLLRVALGLACVSHGVNFIVLSAGRWGVAPIVEPGLTAESTMKFTP